MYYTKRLKLRRVDPQKDIDDRYRWMNDPDVMRLLGMRPARLSRDEVKKYLEQSAQSTTELVEFAIDTRDGRHIGGCTLRNFDHIARKAEFAIVIGEADYRNKGYGTEAVRAVLQIAFEEFNLNRVWLTVYSDNTGAIKAYEKAGFTREGTLRQYAYVGGKYHDTYLMSILREEYDAGKGA